MKRIHFIVEGRPITQGSMTAVYNTRLKCSRVRHSTGAALLEWRQKIAEAAIAAGAVKFNGAVKVIAVFGVPRPDYHYIKGTKYLRHAHTYDRPYVAPDVDKLARALLDALTGVCYGNDAQVVVLSVAKEYRERTEIIVEPIQTFEKSYETAASLDEDTGEDTGERQLDLSLVR